MVLHGQRARLAGLGVLLLVSAVLAFAVLPRRAHAQPSTVIGGPFTLTAAGGQRMTDQNFRGRWLLVYFGYTSCPDVCPTTLAEISQALDRLGSLSAQVQPLFITIDPQRDTAEVIDAYVKAFDARIIGLTGTHEEIAHVAKEYLVYYTKKAFADGSSEAYLMDHTAFVYLVGPDGNYVTLFAPIQGQRPDDIASLLRKYITDSSSR